MKKILILMLTALILSGSDLSALTTATITDAEEYRVYSNAIKKIMSDFDKKKPLIIYCETLTDSIEHQLFDNFKERIDDNRLQTILVQNYNSLNAGSIRLENKFNLPWAVAITESAVKLDGGHMRKMMTIWENYNAKYKNCHGFLALSRIAFNREKTWALLYINFYGKKFLGGGNYVLMKKTNGLWAVKTWFFDWIS
ncbi:MAG: hypothetical protein ACM3WV_01080 [Bacillota bacterium]